MKNSISYKISRSKFSSILIIAVFAVMFFYPICNLFFNISISNFSELLSSPLFKSAIKNSFSLSFIATIFSMLISFMAALTIERTNIHFKKLFSFFYILPMLIPSISHSFGIVSIFGHNGILTNLFNLKLSIYGGVGIVLGSILYSFPVAFIMFDNVLKYEDGNVYNSCKIIGIDAFHQFKDITMPYMYKTFILTFFAIFSLIITDYGVPIMIGAKTITIPVLIYNKAISSLDYSSASSLCIFLLIPAIVAFIVDLLFREKDNTEFDNQNLIIDDNKLITTLSYIFNFFICSFIILILVSFMLIIFAKKYPYNLSFTIEHILKTINKGALVYLKNSVVIAAFVGIIGTVFSFICAYISSRINSKFSKLVHMCAVISMAIPGIVLGLSYLIVFKKSFIYGTILILIIVNIFHFISSPYILAYNSLNKLNVNLEGIGAVLGISKFLIVRDVIIPQIKFTVIEMFTYFFVNSMMTISAVAFLVPPASKPISLMINQFNDQLLIECAAFVSMVILLINISIRLIFNAFSNN